jgi:DNA-binding transcriptional LysR family regulator
MVRGQPRPLARKLSFLSLGHLFDPEFICLVTRKDKTRSVAMEAFVQLLLQSEKGGI